MHQTVALGKINSGSNNIFMLGIQFSITPPVVYLVGEYSYDMHQCLRRLIFVADARFTVEHVNILTLQEL
jgi:hypothetical protein